MLSSKLYDILKWTNAILFPATAVLITALGDAWGWNLAQTAAVVATVNAVNSFIGLLIGASYVQYNKNKEVK